MQLFLDANVSSSVGAVFEEAGHDVLFAQTVLGDGAPDVLVCNAALSQNRIVVGHDKDMKSLSRLDRFQTLSFIMLYCGEVISPKRVAFMMSIIEHENKIAEQKAARRMFVEVHNQSFRTHR